ncbi:MAG: hypothetical protein JJU11_02975 [Candidatus Sumerlaeia bacterium]|nr:hypothetical protein [Candidatus Sumerlaeia bacterium]
MMFHTRKALFSALSLVLLPFVGYTQTAIPLDNPGFEEPALTMENSFSPTVPGWNQSGAVGITWRIPWADPSPPPEGDQYIFANGASSTISQEFGVVEAGKRYIFTIDMFALEDRPDNSIEVAFDIYQEIDNPGGEPFNAFLRTAYSVYNVEWYEWLKDFDLHPQTWTTVQVILDADDYPNLHGNRILARVTGNRFAADNARLVTYEAGEYPPATNQTWYISSSVGSDDNDGLSPDSPWQSFRNINARVLGPGDRVLLKRGDQWEDELNLRGWGAPDAAIELTAYGPDHLDRPRIRRQDLEFDRCIVIQRPSNWVIRNMDVGHSKLGLFLRYHNSYNNENVLIENSRFEDITDTTLIPEMHGYELAFSNAIWLGGHVWNTNMEDATVLDGLTIRNCEAYRTAHLFSTAFYFPAPNRRRVTNVHVVDSRAVDCYNGAISVIGVGDMLVERVISIRGGVNNWAGSTLGMVQNSENVVIDNNEFGFIDRLVSADGVGFDFEGDCLNCSFTNNTVHGASGSALLILATMGTSHNLNIEDNVFYNNAWNPWNNEIHVEISSGTNQNTGRIANNGFYRRDSRVEYYSPLSLGFQRINNRLEDFDPTQLITWWDMMDMEESSSWIPGANTVITQDTAPMALQASAEGIISIESPGTWINSHLQPYLWIRTRQTSGDELTVSFVTEPMPEWDTDRRLTRAVAADGKVRDYWIDMREVPGWKTIIPHFRLEWSGISAGDQVGIEHIRFTGSLDPEQERPVINTTQPESMMIYSLGDNDGSVLESSQGSETGGAVAAGASTFNFGDDQMNRRYRGFFTFDTSLIPDNAVVTKAQVGYTRVRIVGTDPWTFGGSLVDGDYGTMDMAVPHFGTSISLESSDWQATPDLENVTRYIVPYKNGLTVMDLLTEEAIGILNREGTTQFRLRMEERGTNFNNQPDYIEIGTGAATGNQRPFMYLEYYLEEAPEATTPPEAPDYWQRPLTLPMPPRDLTIAARESDSITWQWHDHSQQEDEFLLYLAEGLEPAIAPTGSTGENITEIETDGLTPNTLYTMQVSASNTIGESGTTEAVTGLTMAEIPGQPLVTEITDTDILLSIPMGNNPTDTEFALRISGGETVGWLQDDGTIAGSEYWFTDPSEVEISFVDLVYPIEARAKARNREGEETSLGSSTIFNSPTLPDLWLVR